MSYGTKHQTVDGVKKMGSNLFGTCSTASGTAAKVAALDGFDVLVEGVTIHIKMENASSGSNRTLKVETTEAVPIRCNGSSTVKWDAGSVISFTYDGTYWQMNDFYDVPAGDNTTYTLSKSGSTITLTGSDGSSDSVTDSNTRYSLSKSGNTIKLTGTDGREDTVTDANTKYSLSKSGNTIKLIGTDGSLDSVTDNDRVPYVVTASEDQSASVGITSHYYTIPNEPNATCIGIVGWNISTDAWSSQGLTVLTVTAVKILSGQGLVQIRNSGQAAHMFRATLSYLFVPN